MEDKNLTDKMEIAGLCCTAIDLTRYKEADRRAPYAKVIGSMIGMIPLDPKIEEMDIKGIPLFKISDDSVAAVEIENIVKKLGF